MTRRYIVTGGGGFVGQALCRDLRKDGHEVLSISRRAYPALDAIGVTTAQIDLGSALSKWGALFEGYDGVFHTAAKVEMWGKRPDFTRGNLTATQNVVAACRAAGIGSLVFTSSPSVVHTGSDLLGVDESQPIANHFDAFYPETKAMAERYVLSQADDQLHTVSLRPHLIWGPGDTNLIPTVLERARTGKLIRIGNGKNLVDLTFIDDCVSAHRLAMSALERAPESVSGKSYFISQGDPVPLWDWIDHVLVANGLQPVQRAISYRTAMTLATILEGVARALLLVGISRQPRLTRFLVSEMATSHYFNIQRARDELGYVPSCSTAEALQRTFG